jgi:hypothetical protein
MKVLKTYFFLCFFTLTCLAGCKKDDPITENQETDKFYQLIGDTLKFPDIYQNGAGSIYIDFEKDKINDARFEIYNRFSSYSGAENYTKITPLNGYEISFTDIVVHTWHTPDPMVPEIEYDSVIVSIPRVFESGDTMRIGDNFTRNPVMMNYYYRPTGPGQNLWSGMSYGFRRETDFYMAFRNLTDTSQIFAWIRLRNEYNSQNLIITDCRYVSGEEYMVIKE